MILHIAYQILKAMPHSRSSPKTACPPLITDNSGKLSEKGDVGLKFIKYYYFSTSKNLEASSVLARN
jgi:hypothetical protein